MFPLDPKAQIFSSVWMWMLERHTQELRYTGDMAGISMGHGVDGNRVRFQLFSYNSSYHAFFSEFFKDVVNFESKEEEYNDIKE